MSKDEAAKGPRIPYVPSDEPGSIADDLRRRRGGQLIELDRMLLHCPAIAAGWNTYMGAIRSSTSLSDALRELAICYVAVLNEAEYEWQQHVQLAIDGGIPAAVMAQVKRNDLEGLTSEQKLVVTYTKAMTRDIKVDQPLFDEVKAHLGETMTVELTATIAAYNMVSRFLVALHIGR